MEIKKVGVVGCGLMGSGIAQVSAQAGYSVTVQEVAKELLDKGLKNIEGSLKRAVERGRLSQQDLEATLARIKGTVNPQDLAGSDLIIEAAVEDLGVKKQVFATLDRACPPHTVLATNTSSLPIIELAAATKRPEKVVGIHFFNPAPVMKLIEVIPCLATSPETVAAAKTYAQALGKTVVLAKDSAGFIVNRLLTPYLLHAIRLLESGVATREDIDNGMVLGCNHPMGPLALIDLVGLDTLLRISEVLYNEYREDQFTAPPLLRRLVAAGRLGRKTGVGFYKYG